MKVVPATSIKTIAAALGICLLALPARAEIAWESSLRKAHTRATDESKLLLVHVIRDNCVYCDKLEAGAFADSNLNQAVAENFVPLKINVSDSKTNAKLGQKLKVDRYPMDVVMTTDGTVLSHGVSPQAPGKYVAMLTASLDKAPGISPPNATSPYESGVDSPAIAQTAPATNRTPSAQLASASLPSKDPVGAPMVPELAMDGFCAVSVIQQKEWVEGKPQHGVIHLGKLYLFADSEAKEEFLRDPTPYTPVLNEIDVVRFFEERRVVQGSRQWSVHEPISNRMFFFADEDALVHFEQHYDRYIESAIDVMNRAIAQSNP
ncbi:MAG: thioredoxin fold domain-containing protein [Planctomycetota bacterium]